MNPLSTLPAKWRRRLYAGYAWAVFGFGATQVGYVTAGADQPTVLTVALGVAAYVGAVLGWTAATNVPADDVRRPATGGH